MCAPVDSPRLPLYLIVASFLRNPSHSLAMVRAPPSPLRLFTEDEADLLVDNAPWIVAAEPEPAMPQRPISPTTIFRNRLYDLLEYELGFQVEGEQPEHPLIAAATIEEFAAKKEVLRDLSLQHPISEDPFNEAALMVVQWFCEDVMRAALLPFEPELKLKFDRSAARMMVVEEAVVAAVIAGESIGDDIERCFAQPVQDYN